MKTTLLLACLLGLTACGGKNGGGSPEKASSPVLTTETEDSSEDTQVSKSFKIRTKRTVTLSDDFSNLEDFKDNINSYKVEFEAVTGHYAGASVECNKMFDRTRTSFSAEFDKTGKRAVIGLHVSAADPSVVEYDCYIKDGAEELGNEQVKLLKSYVISGKSNFVTSISANQLGTLLLDKNAVLSTDGAVLDLKVKEFISLDAKIVTFEANKTETTSDNRAGASGGILNLEIEKAKGKVAFELRGLNGGKQTLIPQKISEKLAPGADGNCNVSNHNAARCSGKPGKDGAKGLKGYPGFAGGDAGILSLKTTKESDIEISVSHFPGKGSDGSIGGEGQEGRKGGKGKTITERDHDARPGCAVCSGAGFKAILETYNYPPGKDGKKGAQGDHGSRGVDGVVEKSKIHFEDISMKFEIIEDWKNF